jgi:nicotinamide mononucleotide transporter
MTTPRRISPLEVLIGVLLGMLLVLAAWQGWVPTTPLEAIATATGAFCVYLVVREHVWNFPVGILSTLCFLVIFTQHKLYGDAGLQVMYLVLAVQGWYLWLHGGEDRTPLRVSHASPRLLAGVLAGVVPGTFVLMLILQRVNGSAPFLDSFTTVLSLAAQFLLNRKHIENWYVWFVVDVIYIPLYISRGLYLTAGLYAVFLALCIAGIVEWRKSLLAQRMEESPRPGGASVMD